MAAASFTNLNLFAFRNNALQSRNYLQFSQGSNISISETYVAIFSVMNNLWIILLMQVTLRDERCCCMA